MASAGERDLSVAQRLDHRLGLVGGVELLAGVLKMGVHRALGDVEVLGDGLRRHAERRQFEDAPLACRQVTGTGIHQIAERSQPPEGLIAQEVEGDEIELGQRQRLAEADDRRLIGRDRGDRHRHDARRRLGAGGGHQIGVPGNADAVDQAGPMGDAAALQHRVALVDGDELPALGADVGPTDVENQRLHRPTRHRQAGDQDVTGAVPNKPALDNLEYLVCTGIRAEADCVSQDIVWRIHGFDPTSSHPTGRQFGHICSCFSYFSHKNA
ncbi:hypothetical protein KL86PLE_30042 [uncultured Pleomorphomonas sp.]|uniref:Uncharacterized protein n=1 Tax=uncultured Pleomorphomonas sp. TaxID=442121 RepID=A0A212LDI8_9HYPH|nr:hypothetical protein KL86PLE_30042 [uncultured Pleomorphomonas sp.]